MDNIVLALFAILFALIITYSMAVGYLEGKTTIQYQSDLNQPNDLKDISSSDELSYGMWINVNKPGFYKTSDGRHFDSGSNYILNRPGELRLFIENGTLKMKRGGKTYEIMSNFPLQKWVYITITVENTSDKNVKSFASAYIDGKLIKSYQMSPITGTKTKLAIGQFDAKLVGLKRWKYPLNTKMVENEYEATNIKKTLGNYNLDISVLKNEELSKRFTIF
ncbi:MAG: LamG-like jellyroll fold domain-containing protein [Flavobacterium sp.]